MKVHDLSFAIIPGYSSYRLSGDTFINQVRLLISEWVPFGSNQIVALNEALGSSDRCSGGMFTDRLVRR